MPLYKNLILIALLLWGNSVFGQNIDDFKNLKCYFFTSQDSLFFNNKNDEKNLNFIVEGLHTNEDCDIFSNTFIHWKGTYDIKISDVLENGRRTVNCRFHKGYSTYNLVQLLKYHFKIETVFVNNDEIPTENLQSQYGNE